MVGSTETPATRGMRRLLTAAMSLLLLVAAGCEGDTDATPDAATPDMGPAAAECVEDPSTHLEIINACTTATAVHKTPVTPLLRDDGTLPPLP